VLVRSRSAVVDPQFDSEDPACNFALRGILMDAGDDTTQSKLIHRVRYGAGVEAIQSSNGLFHAKSVIVGAVYDRGVYTKSKKYARS
jgi:hypothetical protein